MTEPGFMLSTIGCDTSVGAFRKPQANSLYHSFTLRAEKRFSDGLNALVSLTAGKLMDDASQTVTFLGEAGTKQDFYNRQAERSISSFRRVI